jgi:maleylpyruvate isomerase
VLPAEDVAACAASHARLKEVAAGIADASVPSRLPGWTVGHVLTHLARNADSIVRRVRAAAAGELVLQYEGGDEGRAAEIEAGAGRPVGEIVADLVQACDSLDAFFPEIGERVWSTEVLRGAGPRQVPVDQLPFGRWREVEIHLVDLGLGYEPEDWPPVLVERLLPEVLEDLPSRAPSAALLAWALGRGDPPPLASWG